MPYKDIEKRRESSRWCYYRNREKRLIQQRQWDKDNKDKKREYDRKRRLENRDNFIKNINHYARKKYYKDLLEKYGGCQLCSSIKKLEIHHIRYTKKIEDLLLLCQKCHKKLHRKNIISL